MKSQRGIVDNDRWELAIEYVDETFYQREIRPVMMVGRNCVVTTRVDA